MLFNGCNKKDSLLPVVNTSDFISFDQTTITCGGEVYSEGSNHVTSRGVCWNTEAIPTIYNEHTVDGSGSGTFTSIIIGLNPNVTYYFRAYARSKAGTAYGDELTQTTQRLPGLPVVATSDFSTITAGTAQSGGDVQDDGDDPVTARGVCWYTEPNPTAYHTHTNDGTGNGVYYSKLTGLSPSTHYYARAYAINSFGIAYGGEVTFTTTDAIATLTTSATTANCSDKALSGGNITGDGGDFITAKGVCYSLIAGPTISDNKTVDGIGTGAFVSHLAGLIGNSTYHVRAYATNAFGTYYGNETTFTTLETVSDIDGNVYDVALIGTQLWMADNLKTTMYSDGSLIPNVTDNTAWGNLTTPAYCWYNNDVTTYKPNYGALYNWYTAHASNLCPLNWHVPTDTEWSVLVNYLGGNAGTKIKAFGNYTNESNFTALGAGCRTTGFSGLTNNGYFWSSTDAFPNTWARIIDWKFNDVTRFSTQRSNGYSIRCLHD
jgi:uncharacterized protein (TIGR02145 family)